MAFYHFYVDTVSPYKCYGCTVDFYGGAVVLYHFYVGFVAVYHCYGAAVSICHCKGIL